MPKLVEAKLLAYVPLKKMDPPYPDWYKPNDQCAYHLGAPGHSVENCLALKYKVQELLDAGWITFDDAAPNVDTKPLSQSG